LRGFVYVAFHCPDKNMPHRQRKPPRRYRDEKSVHESGDEAPPPPPPPLPDMGQVVAALMAVIPRHGERNNMVGCPSITFFKHKPPMFDGSEGPIAADDWIATFEDLANALSCTDGQKVNYAGLILKGEARHWWKARKTFLIEELGSRVPITWKCFKKEFNDRFFLRA
jgi:hypothetical protein